MFSALDSGSFLSFVFLSANSAVLSFSEGLYIRVWCLIQQINVSFSCVCPVIDHEFPHNIVKVALEPSGSADYFDNVVVKFMINNRIDAGKTDVNLFFLR